MKAHRPPPCVQHALLHNAMSRREVTLWALLNSGGASDYMVTGKYDHRAGETGVVCVPPPRDQPTTIGEKK